MLRAEELRVGRPKIGTGSSSRRNNSKYLEADLGVVPYRVSEWGEQAVRSCRGGGNRSTAGQNHPR